MEYGTKSGGYNGRSAMHCIALQCKAGKVVKQLLIRERLKKKHNGYHGGALNQV